MNEWMNNEWKHDTIAQRGQMEVEKETSQGQNTKVTNISEADSAKKQKI